MSGTGGSPQREASITENPPLNGGGADSDKQPENTSSTDVKNVTIPGVIQSLGSTTADHAESISPNSSRTGAAMPHQPRSVSGGSVGQPSQQYRTGGNSHSMRSPPSAQGGWGQAQSNYPNRPSNRYGGNNDMAQGYGSYHQSRSHYHQNETLSKTNLYIRGLTPNTNDQDLINLCQHYGKIVSTKAIVDQATNKCKGYGFVDFEKPADAEHATQGLQQAGIQAQMAKVRENATNTCIPDCAIMLCKVTQLEGSEQDPTNLYIANLPQYVEEPYLESMVRPFGNVVSVRILRNQMGESRGVGFCRMESREVCERIVMELNKKTIPRSKEPLLVKFADSGNKRRREFRYQHGMMAYDNMHHGQVSSQMMGGQGGMAMGARYSMPVNNQSNYMQQQGSTGGNWGGIATPMYPQVAMSPVNPNASMQQSNIMDSVLAQQLGQMQINPAQSYGMQQNPQTYPQMYQNQGMMHQFQYEVAPSPPAPLSHAALDDHSGYHSFAAPGGGGM